MNNESINDLGRSEFERQWEKFWTEFIDNIQIEGRCTELGRPREHAEFCRLYRACFPHSYERYTMLENERLFRVVPMYIERWLYVEGVPYQEIFETENKRYRLREYKGGS